VVLCYVFVLYGVFLLIHEVCFLYFCLYYYLFFCCCCFRYADKSEQLCDWFIRVFDMGLFFFFPFYLIYYFNYYLFFITNFLSFIFFTNQYGCGDLVRVCEDDIDGDASVLRGARSAPP
jgi:hypothetical protein